MTTRLYAEPDEVIWKEFVIEDKAEEVSRVEEDGVDWCAWWAEYDAVME
jgi:hypothetical protein